MFGFPRLKETVGGPLAGQALIDHVLAELAAFVGPDTEQEDDITMVTLVRAAEEVLAEFELASEPGSERAAIERVLAAVDGLGLPKSRLDRLGTAVGEATVNAMEHGNAYQADRPVAIRVLHSAERLRVLITDLGGAGELGPSVAPDLEAKLAGEQSPRGWGLFLIEKMVDEANVTTTDERRTLELVLRPEGGEHGDA
jgi:anti-sigma regulatory factor (Ser/Thr protein kinase)